MTPNIQKYLVIPSGTTTLGWDNHISICNRTRLYAVSVLDCTPFAFVNTTISRSHYFPVLLCFWAPSYSYGSFPQHRLGKIFIVYFESSSNQLGNYQTTQFQYQQIIKLSQKLNLLVVYRIVLEHLFLRPVWYPYFPVYCCFLKSRN